MKIWNISQFIDFIDIAVLPTYALLNNMFR